MGFIYRGFRYSRPLCELSEATNSERTAAYGIGVGKNGKPGSGSRMVCGKIAKPIGKLNGR